MARLRTLEVGAINVRVHPHDEPNTYEALFYAAFALKRAIRVRGDQHLILSSLEKAKEQDRAVLRGTVARFTEIDPNLPWYDVSSLDEADDAQLKRISIPSDLKPNYVGFSFLFDVASHTFAVEVRSEGETLSIRSIEKYLKILLTDKRLARDFGAPSIDIISDHETLKKIWGMHKIKKLNITVQKPNPDLNDDDEFAERIQQRLLDLQAQHLETNITAVTGQSIKPDNETKALAKVAVRNGSVVAEGTEADGKKAYFASKEHPRIERERYDPDLVTTLQAFAKAALRFFL